MRVSISARLRGVEVGVRGGGHRAWLDAAGAGVQRGRRRAPPGTPARAQRKAAPPCPPCAPQVVHGAVGADHVHHVGGEPQLQVGLLRLNILNRKVLKHVVAVCVLCAAYDVVLCRVVSPAAAKHKMLCAALKANEKGRTGTCTARGRTWA